jgi:hypothetical protein
MGSISVNDVVSVELSEGNTALGVVYRVDRSDYSTTYYAVRFPGKNSKILSVIPFRRDQLTFVSTKEQYQITNPEFFL